MSDAVRGRRGDRGSASVDTTSRRLKARRTSQRHLTCSEFAELFPVTSATWEREPGQSDGAFVQSYRPWNWWLTLTFKDIVSATFALSLLKDWAKDLAREIKTHLTLAVGIELQDRGAPHFHVLLYIHQHAEDFDSRVVAARWRELSKRCGRKNKFEPFDPDRRGGDYLTKDGAWGFLVACPRWSACRRSVCVVDPYAW